MPKKILIIDDDPAIRDMMSMILEAEGYDVVLSDTGDILAELNNIAPDIILLDVHIPTSPRDGDILCTELKAKKSTRKLPVILVSGELDLRSICSACGADDYIHKPFDIILLYEKIKSCLRFT